MCRKLISSFVALSVAIAPLSAANASTFVFRYNSGINDRASAPEPPEVDDTVYGIGNDIQAFYVAPIGYAFKKKIPIATRDVIEWRKDSGVVPSGVDLDVSTGVFTGIPTTEGVEKALYHGYDADGHRIARAEIQFTVFEPVGAPSVVDFYTHTNTYFYGEIRNPEGVTVHHWEPITAYANGMSMMNSAFQGTPTKAGTYGVVWRGFDYLDREVAFAYGDFVVADGPVVEELLTGGSIRETIDSQIADKTKNESFSVTATVQKHLGPLTYRLVPEQARPSGLTFSSSTGKVSGVYDDYETTAAFRIEARDSYDGTTGLSNAFSLTTLPAEVDLSGLGNLSGTVGTAFYRKLKAANLVAGARWVVLQGLLPAGVLLNENTGELTGTPTTTEIQTGLVIGVSGAGMLPAENNPPIQFRIYSEPLEATIEALNVRTNVPFETKGVVVTKGGGDGYTISPSGTLPSGVSFNSASGALSSAAGLPTAGTYDRKLVVRNADRNLGLWQVLHVFNPLAVRYADYEVVRHQWLNKYPTLTDNSIIGTAKYSIRDTDGDPLPSWLNFNTNTGRLYGSPSDNSTAGATYGPYVVTLKDDMDTAPSNPFTVTVKDRVGIELTVADGDVQRYVRNGYKIATARNAYGSVSYTMTTVPANWPATLKLSDDGWLTGTTTDPVGTVYTGVVIAAIDDEDYSKTSESFNLTVLEPDSLGGLYGWLDKTLVWTAGQTFNGVLPPLGNGFGRVTYAFDGASSDVSITDSSNGAFSGMIGAAGTYTLGFTIDDDTDREPAHGRLTLDIRESLKAEADAGQELHRAAYFSRIVPTVTGGVTPYTSVLQGSLPEGLFFSNGRFHGTPTREGAFPVNVTVTDKTGSAANAAFTLNVGAPLPFKVSYDSTPLQYGETGQYGVLKAPKVENALGGVTWQPHVGLLPPGVRFATSGNIAGHFIGTPTATGRWNGIVINATDGEGRAAPQVTVDLVVTRSGEISFADQTFRHRVGTPFTDTLEVGNVVAPMTFTSTDPSGLQNGLVLRPESGAITGQFSDEGSYPGIGVSLVDDMDRKASATVTYDIVGDLMVTASDVTLEQYETPQNPVAPSVTDALGTVSFALAAGVLPQGLNIDATTGAVTGSTDNPGTYPGIVIEGTDVDGMTDRSEAFTVTVNERDPITLSAPSTLSLKRFMPSSFAASVSSEIGAVAYDVTPELPEGLELDKATGEITGSSDNLVSNTVFTLTAVDEKGGGLGTDTQTFTLSVTERDPLTIDGPDAYAFTQYLEGSINYTTTNAIDGMTFTINPALPEGLALDQATGVVSGTSNVAVPVVDYIITAVDGKGGAPGTTTKTIRLSVDVRPALGITTATDQVAILGHGYKLTLEADNVLGGATWQHLSGALPEGIDFDAATGVFFGTPTEYGVTSTVTIAVADAFGGADERTFSFTIQQDGTAITLTATGGTTRVGHAFDIALPAVANLAGDAEWTADTGTTGLVINRKTGKLTGTPTTTFTQNATMTVSDATGRSASTNVTLVSVKEMTVIAPTMLNLTYNHAVDPSNNPVVADNIGAIAWSYSGVLPLGMTFDTATGTFSGKPKQIGSFGPITLTAADTLPGEASKMVSIDVEMNDDPIELSVTDFTTKIGYPVSTAAPTYDNEIGAVRFYSTDIVGTGLSIDASTGVVTGTPAGLMDRYINVSITDTTNRVTSQPLHLKIIPLMQITLPSQLTISALTAIAPVAPTRNYVIGPATWDEIDQSMHPLPEGIRFDTESGMFVGNATELGTFGPFTVTSSDSLGDAGRSNSFVIKVNPGATYLGLKAGTLPDAVKRIENYSFDFTPLLTNVGMDISEVEWSLGSGTPPGLTITDGVLSGKPTLSGIYTFDVQVRYGTVTAKRGYSLTVGLPSIELKLAGSHLPEAKRRVLAADNSYSFDFASLLTTTNIPHEDVVFALEPFTAGEALPTGLDLSGGKLTGTADAEAKEYSFRVKATFINETDESVTVTAAYSLEVTDEISFKFNGNAIAAGKKRLAYDFDLRTLIDEATIKGVTPSALVWSWKVDPARDILTTMETLPDGLSISGTKIAGTPVNSGTYAVVVTASYDGRSVAKTLVLQLDLQTISLGLAAADPAQGTLQADYSYEMKSLATATNIPLSETKWSASADVTLGTGETGGLPPGILLNETSGILSGKPTIKGKFRFIVKATWDDAKVLAEHAEDSETYLLEVAGSGVEFIDVSAAETHTCGLTTTGGVKCWGMANLSGTGTNSGTAFTTPVDVTGLTSGVTSISANKTRTCAVTTSGALKCWTAGITPETIVSSGVASVSVGVSHTCFVTTTGGAKCWGYAVSGRLGDGQTSGTTTIPGNVTGLTSGVASIKAGGTFTCALLTTGGVKCWGDGSHGSLGYGGVAGRTTPVDVTGLSSGVASISTGNFHTCAVTTSGGAKCWGEGLNGRIGNNAATDVLTPVDVSGMTTGVATISAGYEHTCATTSAGGAKCWGNLADGRLGLAGAGDQRTPANVPGMATSVASITTGTAHTCAVMTTGAGKCWGSGATGRLGNGTLISSPTPTDIGG